MIYCYTTLYHYMSNAFRNRLLQRQKRKRNDNSGSTKNFPNGPNRFPIHLVLPKVDSSIGLIGTKPNVSCARQSIYERTRAGRLRIERSLRVQLESDM